MLKPIQWLRNLVFFGRDSGETLPNVIRKSSRRRDARADDGVPISTISIETPGQNPGPSNFKKLNSNVAAKNVPNKNVRKNLRWKRARNKVSDGTESSVASLKKMTNKEVDQRKRRVEVPKSKANLWKDAKNKIIDSKTQQTASKKNQKLPFKSLKELIAEEAKGTLKTREEDRKVRRLRWRRKKETSEKDKHKLGVGIYGGKRRKKRIPSAARRQAAKKNWQRISKLAVERLGRPRPRMKGGKSTAAANKFAPKILQQLSKPRPEIQEREPWMLSKIPHVPVWVAVICFTLNVCIPGLGTLMSGWSLLCCGYAKKEIKMAEITNLVCINMWIALCQVMTIPFCFVGWFWSVFWGIKLIQKAVTNARQKKQHEAELRDMTTQAFRDNMLRIVDTTRIV
ncbi:Uncharacterised protein g7422 [Pycnogonum litorale]